MVQSKYGPGTWAGLISYSRGFCYFPGCSTPTVIDEGGYLVLQLEIAHIRAANKNGPRYDDSMSQPERDSFANLMLLCTPHHKLVDQIALSEHSVEMLQQWKREREGATAEQLKGLSRLTEDRLAEMLNDSHEQMTDRIDTAIAKMRTFDPEAADALRLVQLELIDALNGQRFPDSDTVQLLSRAGRDLRDLNDTVIALRKVSSTVDLPSSAASLRFAANNLSALPELISQLNDAITRLWRARG